LNNTEITASMDKLLANFNFDKVQKAIDSLVA
jgi:hypothetical protein